MTRVRNFEVERKITVIFIIPSSQNDKDGWFFLVGILQAHISKVFNGLNMNPSLALISCKKLWTKVHKGNFLVTIFINDYEGFKVLGQIN